MMTRAIVAPAILPGEKRRRQEEQPIRDWQQIQGSQEIRGTQEIQGMREIREKESPEIQESRESLVILEFTVTETPIWMMPRM